MAGSFACQSRSPLLCIQLVTQLVSGSGFKNWQKVDSLNNSMIYCERQRGLFNPNWTVKESWCRAVCRAQWWAAVAGLACVGLKWGEVFVFHLAWLRGLQSGDCALISQMCWSLSASQEQSVLRRGEKGSGQQQQKQVSLNSLGYHKSLFIRDILCYQYANLTRCLD